MAQVLAVAGFELEGQAYAKGTVITMSAANAAWLKSRKLVEDDSTIVAAAISGGATQVTHVAMLRQEDPMTAVTDPSTGAGVSVKGGGSSAKGSAAVAAAAWGVGKWWLANTNGCACDGVTDDTAAFNALLQKVYAAGGGTIVVAGVLLCLGQITLPNDGATILSQPPIRITSASGAGNDGYWRSTKVSTPADCLDLRYNAPIAKVITQGNGTFEVDHITIKNGGTDTSPFIYTTATTLNFHDMAFSGSTNLNDAFVFGGSGLISNTITSAFQGYNTEVRNVFFDRIRKGAIFNGAANAIKFKDNTISLSCGNPETTAITAATNAAQCTFTIPSHPWAVGDIIRLRVSGFTGNWAPLNGQALAATVTTANAVQLFAGSTDTSGFGAMTGSPVFLSGPFLEFAGSVNYPTLGCIVKGNLFEMTNYGYFARMDRSGEHVFGPNTLWDTNGSTIAYVLAGANAQSGGGTFIAGFQSGYTPCVVGAGNAGQYKWLVLDHRQDGAAYGVGNYFPSIVNLLKGLNVSGGPTNFSGYDVTFGAGCNPTIASGQQLIWSAKTKLYSPADGYLTIWNNAQTGLSGLRFGTSGQTAGFAGVKFIGADVQWAQADESSRSNHRFIGDVTTVPSASVTPANNGDLMVQATSNTQITFKLKGTDGTVRSGSITLA